jgi:hypothetical protein
MHKIIYILLFSIGLSVNAQELNCEFIVIAEQTGNENVQVFKTLEKQLKEFVNNTTWTSKAFKFQEKIECSMVVNILDYNSDTFKATLQVQSSRPIFNTSYSSPVYNFNDKDFSFRYLEFQNLVFNPNQFESNLVSVIAFHIYMILGFDADTFELNAGDIYFKQAQEILNYSQQSGFSGWQSKDGRQNRFELIDNVLSSTFIPIRSTLYNYHIKGLDLMTSDSKAGKTNISKSITSLADLNKSRPNSFFMRVFFDAKSDEIQDIFSDGPKISISETVSVLNRIAPMHSSKWRTINF